jgi:hypothetical protein
MITSLETQWTRLTPPLRSQWALTRFLSHARALNRTNVDSADFDGRISELRSDFKQSASTSRSKERDVLLAAGLLLNDLRLQGWQCRIRQSSVEVQPPTRLTADRIAEKARIRRQELLRRDAQISQPSIQKFVRSMECSRLFKGRSVSIFSVMRDGRELSDSLRGARKHSNNGWAEALKSIVDPYIQVVTSPEEECPFTGLRLMQMWRYFRHTWTNQHTSVPGRSMVFLVRDAAVPFHPIVGIGALSSPIVQISARDTWIGWQPEQFLARVRAQPTAALARWLVRTVEKAIREIYVEDFLEEGIFSARHLVTPNEEVISRLLRLSTEQRRRHHRFVRARDHKRERKLSPRRTYWIEQARMHLFRSKRALSLATYLDARALLKQSFGSRPTAAKLKALVDTGQGADAIRKILKKAKADQVGIAVADISVCGAIQPYNAILGGKLVAMLSASPQIVKEYARRYAGAESEIASSMAGRPIVRKPNLVLLGTTSLYGVGSSQYNRIKIPCERIGGQPGQVLQYEELGYSEAFGTSQYSDETIDALTTLVHQRADGQRVNSIFGEGVSPKLRKVRAGIELLNFPAELLLRHYRRRTVYGVSLVRNLSDYLLGLDRKPIFLFRLDNDAESTIEVAEWWRERWLRGRINSEAVLDEVARHSLVRPIRHGARVPLPASELDTGLDRELLHPVAIAPCKPASL